MQDPSSRRRKESAIDLVLNRFRGAGKGQKRTSCTSGSGGGKDDALSMSEQGRRRKSTTKVQMISVSPHGSSKKVMLDDAEESLVCSITDSPYYIYTACSRGLTDVVNVLLSEKPEQVHELSPTGQTCLHYAVARGQLEVVRILLHHDADINAADSEGNTPLHTAVEKGQVEAVRQLLLAGADGNINNKRDLAPIHLATINNQSKILEVLVSFPNLVDVNRAGERGRRALHYAAKFDHHECVEILLRAGCKLCQPCDFGFYPTHTATMNSSIKSLEAMMKFGEQCGYSRGCMLSFADKENNSPLHLAVNSGNFDVVRICLEHGAKIDCRQESQATAFHFACSQGSLAMVKLMYENHLKRRGETEGRDILAAVDNAGMTPLHRAAMFDHVTVIKYLIEQKADINAADRQQCTPLLLAASKGATRSVRVLLEAGADMTLRDNSKRHILHFPVMYASAKMNEGVEIVDLVCKREEGSILLNMKDDTGRTPLHVASKEGHLKFAELLMKLGAIITLKDNEDQSPLHFAAKYGRYNTVRRLLDSPAGTNVINETDSTGATALHYASANGHLKVVELLLERGAILHRSFLGQTPLHLAAISGYTSTIRILLIFHGSLIDQKCRKGYTALHYACEENQAEAAALLLSSNCEYCLNNDGQTPIDIAIKLANVEVAIALVNHERWKPILIFWSPVYGCAILALIQYMPEVFKVVLDRCCTKADCDSMSRDYWIKFNFEFLQVPIEKFREFRKDPTRSGAKPLWALNNMVRFGRVELLSHPLCLNYITMKWLAYGMWFFMLHISLYSSFVLCLTVPTLLSINTLTSTATGQLLDSNSNQTNLTTHNEDINDTFPFDQRHERKIKHCNLALAYAFLFAAASILKECFQLYQQRLRYLNDYVNYAEVVMYVAAIAFAGPAFTYGRVSDFQWQCASVAVFLAWFILLLYLQRLETVGLYVVMFLQILNTVLKVVLAFTLLFIAFGVVFFMLLSDTPNGSFKTPTLGILQAMMDLIGEYNYVDVYVRPYFDAVKPLKYVTLNFVFLIVFVILMPILFVNMLIGLAVGDIEMVQRDARLKRLAMQVEYHTQLEEKLPLWVLKKVDRKELTIGLNDDVDEQSKLSLLSRKERIVSKVACFLTGVCKKKRLRTADAIFRQHHQVELSNEAVVDELDNLKRRLKEIQTKSDNMHDMLRLIVQKMEIITEADAYEGRRHSEEEDDDQLAMQSTAARRRISRLKAKMSVINLGKPAK